MITTFLVIGAIAALASGGVAVRVFHSRRHDSLEPTVDQIKLAISRAFAEFDKSQVVRDPKLNVSTQEALIMIRGSLVSAGLYAEWRTYGAWALHQLADMRDRYAIAFTKSNSNFDYSKSNKLWAQVTSIEKEAIAFSAQVQNHLHQAIATAGKVALSGSDDTLALLPAEVLEPVQHLPESSASLKKAILDEVEQGLAGIEDSVIRAEAAVLKSIKADYLPNTLRAYAKAAGEPAADDQLDQQLRHILAAAKNARLALQGNPLADMSINARFLDQALPIGNGLSDETDTEQPS